MNSVFTGLLKRWLGVPKWANNAITHYICGTQPLDCLLNQRRWEIVSNISLPDSFQGFRPSFLEPAADKTLSDTELHLPVEFLDHVSTILDIRLPYTFSYRNKLAVRLLDTKHMNDCSNKSFHIWPEDDCMCVLCGEEKQPYQNYN